MARVAKTKAGPAKSEPSPPKVVVVGGGLAGLTAALRLRQSGFDVTLLEATSTLGGNLSSETVNGLSHDVYPHMFCEWYSNFWAILDNDLGIKREEAFSPRMGVKMRTKGASEYIELHNATTPEAVWANLTSGALSFPDMFLLGFSMLDLAATPFDRRSSQQLERLDVNGFIYSRGYSTNRMARLQNYILMVIWSIQSVTTAAVSYQDFIKHTLTFPHPSPFAWLLKTDTETGIIQPLARKLDTLGCEIRLNSEVVRVELDGDAPLVSLKSAMAGTESETLRPDFVILATPAPVLAKLVMSGSTGRRIAERAPALAKLQTLTTVAIPVVDVWFKSRLPDMPSEQVGLAGSPADLTFLDLSQLWTAPEMSDRTVLALASSDASALPSLEPHEQAHLMIKGLHDYLPVFEPGDRWGDPKSDIDWEKSHFSANENHRLFMDTVGSWESRPRATCEGLKRVFFAGDFCRTDVDMATVEAAVQSGLQAALAVQGADAAMTGATRGDPVAILGHERFSDTVFLAAKFLLLPSAYLMTALSPLMDRFRHSFEGIDDGDEENPSRNAYSEPLYSLLLPLALTLDLLKTGYWLVRRIAEPAPEAKDGLLTVEAVSSTSILPTAASAGLMAASQALRGVAATLPGRVEPGASAAPRPGAALGPAWRRFGAQLARTVAASVASTGETAAPHRHWRTKG